MTDSEILELDELDEGWLFDTFTSIFFNHSSIGQALLLTGTLPIVLERSM